MHEPDGKADRQQHERGDDGQPHVYLHDSFDNEVIEKVLGFPDFQQRRQVWRLGRRARVPSALANGVQEANPVHVSGTSTSPRAITPGPTAEKVQRGLTSEKKPGRSRR